MNKSERIDAIILGAGLSTRMGYPKLLLKWKSTTVLGNIVSTLASNEIKMTIVVVHPDDDHLIRHVRELSIDYPVRSVSNDSFKPEGMLTSIQYGLRAIDHLSSGVLIALGDQPQIEGETIRRILHSHQKNLSSIIIPSFYMQRGHPWLIPANLISRFIDFQPHLTPRDFLELHKDEIEYAIIENDSILKDIDTPNDYRSLKPII